MLIKIIKIFNKLIMNKVEKLNKNANVFTQKILNLFQSNFIKLDWFFKKYF